MEKINRTDASSKAPIMMISAASGFINQSDKYSRDNAGKSLKKYTLLKEGELAYNHGASKLREFGCCFELNVPEARVPYVYHTFAIKHENCTPYIAILLNNPIIDRQLKKIVSSSVRMDGLLNISYENYIDISINIPGYTEQMKVATFFKLLDKKIELQKKIVEHLKLYKRGLLSKLFPQKQETVPQYRFKGFSDTWEQRKVGEVLIERNEQSPKSDEYPLMAFIANEGVAPKGERYDRSALVNDTDNKLYKRTEYGDFIYSSNNLETGSIGLNKYGKATISPVYSIFESTGIANSDFLGRRLVRKDFINEMVRWRQGVVYGQWKIHETDFVKIEISVPSVQEQRKIGLFLDKLDNLITLHQRKLLSLENYKYELLQQLFI